MPPKLHWMLSSEWWHCWYETWWLSCQLLNVQRDWNHLGTTKWRWNEMISRYWHAIDRDQSIRESHLSAYVASDIYVLYEYSIMYVELIPQNVSWVVEWRSWWLATEDNLHPVTDHEWVCMWLQDHYRSTQLAEWSMFGVLKEDRGTIALALFSSENSFWNPYHTILRSSIWSLFSKPSRHSIWRSDHPHSMSTHKPITDIILAILFFWCAAVRANLGSNSIACERKEGCDWLRCESQERSDA